MPLLNVSGNFQTAPCHGSAPPSSDVRDRARQLWRRLGKRDLTDPAHASGVGESVAFDRRTPLGRATWDLLLVLEDPAAGAHSARYARALLDAAASVIERNAR